MGFEVGQRVRVRGVNPGEYMTSDDVGMHGVGPTLEGERGVVKVVGVDGENEVFATVLLDNGEKWDFYERELEREDVRRIESMADLCEYFCADEPAMLNKRIYKGTDCGASISVRLTSPDNDEYPSPPFPDEYAYWVHNGNRLWNNLTMDTPIHSFTIQTIVEGSDATVDSEPFVLPVKVEDVAKWIEAMEAEAAWLWEEANEDFDEED